MHVMHAQAVNATGIEQKVQQLTDALAKTQAQLEQSQHELADLRRQLSDLRDQIPQAGAPGALSAGNAEDPPASPQEASSSTTAQIDEIRERQALEESEIATQAQLKVESESKYPVRITGMVLMNGFKNTGAVDLAANPSIAVGGSGSAGASLRQTILGIDARGPHLFGAQSFGDLRVDFFASPAAYTSTTSYANYSNMSNSLLRLRTAHVGLNWSQTEVYFALDRAILNPDTPTSITAVALPALAWSGNLWTWNPQAGITQELHMTGSQSFQLQAALIDPGDAPLTPALAPNGSVTATPPTSAEQSSRPGVEARIAMLGSGRDDERDHIGVGGYFSEHVSALGRSYDSWAATLDARLALFAHLQLTTNAYRGLALGGLGAGGYKDFAYSPNPFTGGYYFRPLDDVGGWTQLKEKPSERLEFNAAYGMDNVFARQLQRYYVAGGPMAENLARNRTYTGNVIYSPSAYLLLSFEYRRINSAPVLGMPAESNIFGMGAGYKF